MLVFVWVVRMTKQTLSVPETANMLNVHENTVFKLIDSGTLPAAKIGRSYVLLFRDVMQYVESQVSQQTAQRMGGAPVKRRRSPQLVGHG